MTSDLKELIEIDAKRAAKSGLLPIDACPYPFKSEEGMHWLAIYALNRVDK